MNNKTANESFISPYLERPLRSIEEVLRGLPKERRLHLMNIVESSAAVGECNPDHEIQAEASLKRRTA